MAGQRILQAAIGLRRNAHLAEPGRLRQRIEPAHVPVHPLTNGAVGVVVQGVHAGVPDGSVRLYGVPTFPDGGGPKVHTVQPAWKLFVEQQLVGCIIVSVGTEYAAQVRGAHKAGLEVKVVGLEQRVQPCRHAFPILVRHEIHEQRHHRGGLGVHGQPAGGGKDLRLVGSPDFVCQPEIGFRVGHIAQHRRRARGQRGGIVVVCRGDEVDVRTADGGIRTRPILRQPVTEAEIRFHSRLPSSWARRVSMYAFMLG